MRNYNSTFHVVNALTGVIVGSGATVGTLQGNTIDTIGFNSMLGVLLVGSLQATNAVAGQQANLTVKFQEAAAEGTNWTDITDGACVGTASVFGSATFDVLAVSALPMGTYLTTGQYQRKMFIRLGDGVRKRYLRCNASIVGTAGARGGWSIAVGALLGRPRDSAYIIDATAYTTSVQSEWGIKYGTC